jgi:hypothetical protein
MLVNTLTDIYPYCSDSGDEDDLLPTKTPTTSAHVRSVLIEFAYSIYLDSKQGDEASIV